MRGVFVAEEDNFKSYYINNIFDAIWQDGLNMNDENIVQKVLKNLNVNPKTFTLRSNSASIKDTQKKKNKRHMKKVFWCSYFVSNNKLFWGQDRIEFVIKEASNKLFLFFATTLSPASFNASKPPLTCHVLKSHIN